MRWVHPTLRLKLDAVQAAASRVKVIVCNVAETVCTWYSSMVQTQATSYRACLDVLHADTKIRE